MVAMGKAKFDKNEPLFAVGTPQTRVIVHLTDSLDDVSAMAIQKTLHDSGLHVIGVHADRLGAGVKAKL